LKADGQFVLHCDPTASHYLKTLCDAIFVARGGDYRNEIIWAYESGGRSKQDFGRKHDILFRYTKSKKFHFDGKCLGITRADVRDNHMKRGVDPDGRQFSSIKSNGKSLIRN
jgi:site-specific DNA-methyltransferase (adenine-specific)